MDPAKLKVVELRAELSARGLDTKGVKAVLVERLKKALEEETGQEVPDTSIVDTSTEETSISEEKAYSSEPDKEQSEPERDLTPEKELSPKPDEREPTPEPIQEDQIQEEPVQEEPVQEEPVQKPEREVSEPEGQQLQKSQDVNMEDIAIKQEPQSDDFKQEHYEQKPDFGQYQGYDKKEHYEADVKLEPGLAVKEEKPFHTYDERKRKRSRSPQGQKQGWGQSTGWGRKDDEPDLDDEAMVLGWYDSDLNLEIEKADFLEAAPMSKEGFGFIWAGCRATFGFNSGKVCYEVKLLENHDVSHLEDEPSPHVLRIGWSVLSCSMLLGEEPMSYGYGGTAKASTNCKFTNYGKTFGIGDTITAYLDYGDRIKVSYSVNGAYQREAFNIPASQINNQALFPHILSKNIRFRVNFGQSESEFPPQPGYTWAAHIPLDKRVPGPRRPEKREDCEMLMMCGLPGCGKTTWANAYVQENPAKFYNILGTNNLIDKMKIQGLPRKRNYSGRWDVLIDKCTKCLNKLLEMGSRRRRNYILDQTNVYPSAQKRKMRNFGGFIRRAIVIVPSDEEFQRRCAKREAEEGKDIPDSAVLEMKANFRLPEEGEHFDEVRYIELNEDESRPLVEQYNKEGRAAGFGQQPQFSGQGGKKFRPNDRPPFRGGGGSGGGGGFRGGRGGGGGFGGGMDRRDRSDDRGPPGGGRGGGGFRSGGPPMKGGMDRGGRGGWQPRGGSGDRGGRGGSDRGGRGGGDRGGRGGWQDRSSGGNYDRDSDNRAPGGGAWRNNRSVERDRPYDRNQRGGRGGRGGYDRDNFRDDDYNNRGGGFRDGGDSSRGGSGSGSGSGYDRDDYSSRGSGGGGNYNSRDGGYNRDGGNFRDNRGGSRGSGGSRGVGNRGGGFDRDQRGGGRGGFDRNRGGSGGFNDRRGGGGSGGGGNRDGGGFDRNRGGSDRGSRDNKGGSGNQGSNQGQGWGNQGSYNSGWGQQQQGGYSNQGSGGGYNQSSGGGYNQSSSGGYNQSSSGGYSQGGGGSGGQQPSSGWGGQQNWKSNYGTGTTQQQMSQPPPQMPQSGQQVAASGTAATPAAATGYNTGYTQQAQAQYAQGYWGQYGYGQGWTQNADGTYSYPQGWQQYGYNYGQAAAAPAVGATAANTAAATQAAPK